MPTRLGGDYNASVIETAYSALLVLMALIITWFAGYVVYKLYKGQG